MPKQILIAVLFILSTLNADAQDTKARVQAMFMDSTATVQFYRGRMNDINDVLITLGSDGREYKGIMKFFRSNAEFRVTGTVKGKTLHLIERDSFYSMTGKITGTIDNFEGIKADWINYDNSVGGKMHLIPYPTEPEYPTYCGDNKWIRIYSGKIGDEVVDFILSRGTNFQVEGLAYFQKQNRSYRVEGEITNYNRDIALKLRGNDYKDIGKISGKIDFKTDNIEATFTDLNARTFNSTIKKVETISMGCIEYADFISEMEVTYPKTRSIKFNEMLNGHIQDWLATARTYTRQYRGQFARPTAKMRASLRSYYWCDVDYYSDRIISGKATYTNTWENGYQGYAFNFDFKNNKTIELKDIFKEGTGYEAFIQKYVRTALKKRPFFTDPAFQVWLKKETFPYFTIRKEGINFISGFNAIFGEQNCTIPYSELKPYLKAESAINFLVIE